MHTGRRQIAEPTLPPHALRRADPSSLPPGEARSTESDGPLPSRGSNVPPRASGEERISFHPAKKESCPEGSGSCDRWECALRSLRTLCELPRGPHVLRPRRHASRANRPVGEYFLAERSGLPAQAQLDRNTVERPRRSEAKQSATTTRNCSQLSNSAASRLPIAAVYILASPLTLSPRATSRCKVGLHTEGNGPTLGCAPSQTGADYNSREPMMRSTPPILFSVVLLFLPPFLPHTCSLANAQAGILSAGKDEQGHTKSTEGRCTTCHGQMVRSYSETAMARASGPALKALIPGEFLHQPSGVRYRIYEENGKAWLSFERDGAVPLKGRRELLYFIGSGHRGRTYLFNEGGFTFDWPVNWEAQAQSRDSR